MYEDPELSTKKERSERAKERAKIHRSTAYDKKEYVVDTRRKQAILKALANVELKLLSTNYYEKAMKQRERFYDIYDEYTEQEIKENKNGVLEELKEIMPMMRLLLTEEGVLLLKLQTRDKSKKKKKKLGRIQEISEYVAMLYETEDYKPNLKFFLKIATQSSSSSG